MVEENMYKLKSQKRKKNKFWKASLSLKSRLGLSRKGQRGRRGEIRDMIGLCCVEMPKGRLDTAYDYGRGGGWGPTANLKLEKIAFYRLGSSISLAR